jgi:cytochrome c peroxidase
MYDWGMSMGSSLGTRGQGRRLLLLGVVAFAAAACGDDGEPMGEPVDASVPVEYDAAPVDPNVFVWDMVPEGLPKPFVPEENPMTYTKVELGRYLFFDEQLSGNGTQSCGSCHEQELAFADGIALPIGSTGEVVPRNSLGLMNVAYHTTFTWMNPEFHDLRTQIQVPLFGEFPVELGVSGNDEEVLMRFSIDPDYIARFAAAFPDEDDPITFGNIAKALASFVRSMVSFDSPYDRHSYKGDTTAMSESALRGQELFFEERIDCHHCHGNFHFSLNVRHENTVFIETGFANNGLYNVGNNGSYPAPSEGLVAITERIQDRGKMRTSSLRNVAITGPYMHDGSIETLEEVLDMYERGGRFVTSGPNVGDGRDNPFKSEFVHGFVLTEQERADVLAFLESLTDETFLVDPKFSNPFEQ